MKAGKEPKWAQVNGLDDTEFAGFDMGAWVTQDLLVALLGILQEMSVQSEIMRQMLQFSMVQLDILQVGSNDLALGNGMGKPAGISHCTCTHTHGDPYP